MNADGSNQHEIPNTFHSNYEVGRYGSYGGNPVFSPGGGKIVFSSDRTTGPGVDNPTGDEELFIKNADGSGDPQQITFNRKRDVEPDWQPIR